MTPRTRVLAVVATCSVLAGVAGPPGYAAVSRRCFGRTATIVASGRGHHRIRGTGGDDVIVVTGGRATVNGHRGNDRICTAGRSDRIRGGKGDDRIRSGRGRDRIWSGKDHDVVRAGKGNDTVHGGNGVDRIRGGRGADALAGEDNTDHVRGGAEDDVIHLGPGDPDAEFEQTALGGAGNDEINGSDEPESIYGGPGDDFIHGHLVYESVDALFGQDGDDRIVSGRAGGRTLPSDRSFSNGGEGADVLEDLDGGGILNGGPGDDVLRAPEQPVESSVSFEDADAAVVVDLPAGIATGEGTDVLSGSFEGIVGSRFDDELIGDAHGNVINGRDGNDTVRSGEGDDTILGVAGDDLLDGGPGEDTTRFFTHGELTVDLSRGVAEGDGSDVLSDVENVASSGGDHVLIGDDDVNELTWSSQSGGSIASARIEGRGGDDDIMFYGDGVVDAGEGDDFVYAPSIVSGEVQGGDGDDAIRLQQTFADGGDPVVVGGGAGSDVIDFRDSWGAVHVDPGSRSAAFVGWAHATTFELSSIENVFASGWADTLIGDDGPNRIVGGNGDDVVEGHGGDDDLDGGGDFDELDGGDGTDRCVNGERLQRCEA